MSDGNRDAGRTNSQIIGKDNLGALRTANTVVRGDGLTAIAMDGQVTVTSTFGFDQQPDTYFQIVNTGAAGNTWTVFIKGTAADPSSPDRDLPDYTKIFTVVSGEVGDELKLRDRIITELNADTVFKNTIFMKANRATDRAVVHISSQKFSASGEFYERPNVNDFMVTVTGTAVVIVGFDNIISRSKPVTISRDLDSPHRLGTFGVSGSVSIQAKELSDLFTANAVLSGSSDLRVNGSVTPQVFTVPAQATQIFVEMMYFHAQGNGIQFGKFISQNSPIANGVVVTIKSDDVITTFPNIKTTEDFKNLWAALSGDGANFKIDVQAGRDEMLAILKFPNPFLIRESGAFGSGNDDYIRVTVNDNLSANISEFRFRVKGFEKEP